jgi:hypothetical protein
MTKFAQLKMGRNEDGNMFSASSSIYSFSLGDPKIFIYDLFYF